MILSLILSQWFWAVFIVLIFYIGDLLKGTKRLKRERDYLESEKKTLQKIVFDLSEDKKYLMDGIMEFNNGNLTKGDLIKGVQYLINRAKKEIEKDKIVNNLKDFYNS